MNKCNNMLCLQLVVLIVSPKGDQQFGSRLKSRSPQVFYRRTVVVGLQLVFANTLLLFQSRIAVAVLIPMLRWTVIRWPVTVITQIYFSIGSIVGDGPPCLCILQIPYILGQIVRLPGGFGVLLWARRRRRRPDSVTRCA